MKQKLLKTMIALIAIVMPGLSYAQSQTAEGIYNGTLSVKLGPIDAGSSTENVYLIAENDNHIRLEIRNFKFSTGEGDPLELGDIIIPNAELQQNGNTIIILPTDAQVTLPEIGTVNVHLNQSTITDKNLALTLSVQVPDLPLPVTVGFEGIKTGGVGIYDANVEKPKVYYNSATNSLIVKNVENQKYDIYNITGMQILSGTLNAEEINVSNLSKGIYLIKIGNNTVKFIKK